MKFCTQAMQRSLSRAEKKKRFDQSRAGRLGQASLLFTGWAPESRLVVANDYYDEKNDAYYQSRS